MISQNKIFLFLFLLYATLLIGFYFDEDIIGGALNDYVSHSHIAFKFKDNFFFTLINYDDLGHRHSPIFYIIKSIVLNFGENWHRIFFLHLYLLIPLFFYKCLKLKFKFISKSYLKLIAALVFLFPTYRAYSIWPDPHLLGVLFFIISIFYYLKVKANINPFKNSILNSLFLSFAAYASPNFGIFVIFFFYEFFKKFSLGSKILKIVFLNIILSLPFFLYLFYFDANFVFNNNGWDVGSNFYSLENISNKIIIIISLFLFYLLPFVIFKFKYIKFNFSDLSLNNFLAILVFLFIIFFFDFSASYKLTNSGGGIFYNLSNFLFHNDYLLFLLCFLTYLYLFKVFMIDKKNLIIFLCLVLSNPQITIWQANFSPTLFFVIFLLFNSFIDKNNLKYKNLIISYLYFLSYLLLNFLIRNILI